MDKVKDLNTALVLADKFKKQNKKIVVTGGCFDILHLGHIRLLRESKKQGDLLFVLLENDKTVKKLKGEGRPINTQAVRAEILAALECIDYVVLLPEMKTNKDYDKMVFALSPDIITTTKNDLQGIHNERQAKQIKAKVVYVTDRINNKSTTILAKIISEQFTK